MSEHDIEQPLLSLLDAPLRARQLVQDAQADVARAIAMSLTGAQRQEVLRATTKSRWPDVDAESGRRRVWCSLRSRPVAPDIYAEIMRDVGGWWSLTPLGMRVRAALVSIMEGDGDA